MKFNLLIAGIIPVIVLVMLRIACRNQEKSLRQLVSLLDQVRKKEEGERFMAMLSDLQLIFTELNTPNELAGISISNIAENQTFKDLVAQKEHIRIQMINPVYP